MEVIVIRILYYQIAQEVEDRETAGWRVTRWRDDGEVIMRRERGFGSLGGHLLVGFFTGISTCGLCNLIYGLHARGKTRQELHLRPEVDRSEGSVANLL